jgi:hypothetical protein
MRLVFLLYAEERETFPSDDLFVRNYSIAGLFARLVEDEGRHPDTMDQRYGAWAHLISLFRLVYGGARYDGPDGKLVKIPARQGDLFDPSRFPFLEGQSLASEPGGRHPLPQLADGTVLRVLRNLLYLGQERLSYRSLEVEQIGSVYEAVMGYRVESRSSPRSAEGLRSRSAWMNCSGSRPTTGASGSRRRPTASWRRPPPRLSEGRRRRLTSSRAWTS